MVFIGEPSFDEGGPRREFFQLALKDYFVKSGLFAGWPHNVLPVVDSSLLVLSRVGRPMYAFPGLLQNFWHTMRSDVIHASLIFMMLLFKRSCCR